jgi:hypothetical protein
VSSVSFAEQHRTRSAEHYETAERLLDAEEEWASVAYFYACYRAVRAAFYNDERLNSDAAARAVHPKLSAGSRHVDFHSGHPSRGPGVNDVVRFLYPTIQPKYELLHIRSVEVRYAGGITGGTVAESQALAQAVIEFLRGADLM